MNRVIKAAVVWLIVFVVVPASANAQLGALKKKLKEKASGIGGDRPVAQWKAGERAGPFTQDGVAAFLATWKTELDYQALSSKERERVDAEDEAKKEGMAAKKEERNKCAQNAVGVNDIVELQGKMQARATQLEQAGDANGPMKAAQEMEAGMEKLIAKKCGPAITSESGSRIGTSKFHRTKEWVCSYVAIRSELGRERAAAAVLATEEEVGVLEANIETIQRYCAIENGAPAGKP
jgi:hypothetical protein